MDLLLMNWHSLYQALLRIYQANDQRLSFYLLSRALRIEGHAQEAHRPPEGLAEGALVGGGVALAGLPGGGSAEEDAEPILVEDALAFHSRLDFFIECLL